MHVLTSAKPFQPAFLQGALRTLELGHDVLERFRELLGGAVFDAFRARAGFCNSRQETLEFFSRRRCRPLLGLLLRRSMTLHVRLRRSSFRPARDQEGHRHKQCGDTAPDTAPQFARVSRRRHVG